jgi:hypothetical protein
VRTILAGRLPPALHLVSHRPVNRLRRRFERQTGWTCAGIEFAKAPRHSTFDRFPRPERQRIAGGAETKEVEEAHPAIGAIIITYETNLGIRTVR